MNDTTSAADAVGPILIVFALCYFIPTVIALIRRHKDGLAIGALNLLLGWSIVGWFIAFFWALTDPSGRNSSQTVIVQTTQHNAPVSVPVSPPAPAPVDNSVGVDPDTAFWDSIPNKSDPDHLEEYLHRFPNGRFATLAQSRFDRATPKTPDV